MKRKTNIWICLIVIAIFLTGCKGKKSSDFKSETIIKENFTEVKEDLNKYEIDIEIDDENKSYSGNQKTRFKNTTGRELKEIYFRLYPNAFKDFDSSPSILGQSYSKAEYKKGYIKMKDISVDGEKLKYKIEGEDETLLKIELDKPLLKESQIEIDMKYQAKLPTSKDRFGYGENTMNFGNWYPVLSVYDEDGWSKDPYYSIGDPFYSEISNYDVNISLDKDIVLASSGNILEEEIVGDKKTYKIEGQLIRDFAFSASRDFKIEEEKIDDTLVKLYYLDNNETMIKEALKYSKDSLKVFNKHFGKYPYGTYSVVLTEFPSGMEYPTVVFISKEQFKEKLKKNLEQTIVHETAHQWWYGLVGNDQVNEAWLDEGLTTYSEVIYMENIYGKKAGDIYFEDNIEIGYDIVKGYLEKGDQTVNKPLSEFGDWGDYGPLVYTKAAMFLRDIKDEYDEEIFLDILNRYYQKYKYKIARTEDFLKVCEEVTGDSFESMNEKWLK